MMQSRIDSGASSRRVSTASAHAAKNPATNNNNGNQKMNYSSTTGEEVVFPSKKKIQQINLHAVYCRRLSTTIRLHTIMLRHNKSQQMRDANISDSAPWVPGEEDEEIIGINSKLRMLLVASLHKRARLLYASFETFKLATGCQRNEDTEVREAIRRRNQTGKCSEIDLHILYRWVVQNAPKDISGVARLLLELRSRKRLIDILNNLKLERYGPGQVVFFQTDQMHEEAVHFTVFSGTVQMIRMPSSKTMELKVMQDAQRRGSMYLRTSFLDEGYLAATFERFMSFGELTALTGTPHHFSARAGPEGVELIVLSLVEFQSICAQNLPLVHLSEKINFLRLCGLFSSMSTITQLSILANEMARRTFRKGQILTRQGVSAPCSAFLLAGEIYEIQPKSKDQGVLNDILQQGNRIDIKTGWSLIDKDVLIKGKNVFNSTAVVLSDEVLMYILRPEVYDIFRPGLQGSKKKTTKAQTIKAQNHDALHADDDDSMLSSVNEFMPFADTKLKLPFIFRGHRRPNKADHAVVKEFDIENANIRDKKCAFQQFIDEENKTETIVNGMDEFMAKLNKSLNIRLEREVQTLYRKEKIVSEGEFSKKKKQMQSDRQILQRFLDSPPGNKSKAMLRVEEKLAQKRFELGLPALTEHVPEHHDPSLDVSQHSSLRSGDLFGGDSSITSKPKSREVDLVVTSLLFGSFGAPMGTSKSLKLPTSSLDEDTDLLPDLGSPTTIRNPPNSKASSMRSDTLEPATRKSMDVTFNQLHPNYSRRISQDLMGRELSKLSHKQGRTSAEPGTKERQRRRRQSLLLDKLDGIIDQSRNFIDNVDQASLAESSTTEITEDTYQDLPSLLNSTGDKGSLVTSIGTFNNPYSSRSNNRPVTAPIPGQKGLRKIPSKLQNHLPAIENYKLLQKSSSLKTTLESTGSLGRPGSPTVLRLLFDLEHEGEEDNNDDDVSSIGLSGMSVLKARLRFKQKAEKARLKAQLHEEANSLQLAMENRVNDFGAIRGKRNWKNVKEVMSQELTMRERGDTGGRLLRDTDKMLTMRIQAKAEKKIQEMKRLNTFEDPEDVAAGIANKKFVPNSAYFHALQNTPSPLMEHWGKNDRSLQTFAAGQRSRLSSNFGGNDEKPNFSQAVSQAMGAKRRQHSIEDVVAFKEWQAFHIKQCSEFKQQQKSVPILNQASSSLGWKYKVYQGHKVEGT